MAQWDQRKNIKDFLKFLVRMTNTDILNIEDKEKEVSKSDAGKERKKKSFAKS